MTHKYGTPRDAGYEMIRVIRNVLTSNYPSIWDGLTAGEIVEACEACDAAGELPYATPSRASDDVILWRAGDDRTVVARWQRKGTERLVTEPDGSPESSGVDAARDRAADKAEECE